jgi:hypothetical protein
LTTRRRAPSASCSSSTDGPQPQLPGRGRLVAAAPPPPPRRQRPVERARDHDVGPVRIVQRRGAPTSPLRGDAPHLGQLARDAQRDDGLLDPPQEPTRF